MSTTNVEMRENLAALLAAQRELSTDDQPYLIESFLDDVERQIEQRVTMQVKLQRVAGRRERQLTYVRVVALLIAVFFVGVALHENTGIMGLAGFTAMLLLLPPWLAGLLPSLIRAAVHPTGEHLGARGGETAAAGTVWPLRP